MGKIFTLQSRQIIPASLDAVWDFFSNANNLALLTPPELNLKVTNKVYGAGIYPGQVMMYRVKPLLGISLPWMTEITHVEAKKYFVDEQRKGPYKLWHHQHHFAEHDGGVEMIDIVHYRLPMAFLSPLANSLVVKGKLRGIFEFRYRKIVEMFGGSQQAPELELA